MRRKINLLLIAVLSMVFASCEDYLDMKEESGLSEEDLYTSYDSLLGFLDQVFRSTDEYLVFQYAINSYTNQYASVSTISDEMTSVHNTTNSDKVTNGSWLSVANNTFEIGCTGASSIGRAYTGLRIMNRVIRDIDEVRDITDDQKNSLLGQAHFLRAHFYFEVIKRYGGMPLFNTLIGAADEFNVPRKTYQESNEWMQTDLDKAIELLPLEWDEYNYGRPSKIAAQALKAMTQLYAASPLMQNGLTDIVDNGYGKDMAAQAAVSAQKAIDLFNQGDTFVSFMETDKTSDETFYDSYRSIQIYPTTVARDYPAEHIWFPNTYPGNVSAFVRAQFLTAPYDSKIGGEGIAYNAPTQNMVEMFERKGSDGKYYPITDSRSGYTEYVEQNDPYTDRDPRLKCNIIVPGEKWSYNGNTPYYLSTYVGGYTAERIKALAQTNAKEQTGYLCKKFIWEEASADIWGGNSTNTAGFNLYRMMASSFIRAAQVYLDLAEASYEATGSADAVVPGCTLSARQALNIVRNRGGIGDLPDGVDFREAYRRERAVELMFEGHRWYDIRRWMIAEEVFSNANPIKGIAATPNDGHGKTAANLKAIAICQFDMSPYGFTYETTRLTTAPRVFNKRNYWYPLPMDDVAAFSNLEQNPYWE